MKTISIRDSAGVFAENKDTARDIRLEIVMPTLKKGEIVVLDFDGVTGATQSFVHALISEPFRKYGDKMLELIRFKDCNDTIKEIITIVTEYMQEAE
jgi:hypothetical protein